VFAVKIQSYSFGYIEIDGKAYWHDVKLIGEKVVPDWWRSSGHLVEPQDVKDLLNADAEICVFGTGAYGAMRISEKVKSILKRRGIQVLIEKTESACDTYNLLSKEGKKLVAGLHLTC